MAYWKKTSVPIKLRNFHNKPILFSTTSDLIVAIIHFVFLLFELWLRLLVLISLSWLCVKVFVSLFLGRFPRQSQESSEANLLFEWHPRSRRSHEVGVVHIDWNETWEVFEWNRNVHLVDFKLDKPFIVILLMCKHSILSHWIDLHMRVKTCTTKGPSCILSHIRIQSQLPYCPHHLPTLWGGLFTLSCLTPHVTIWKNQWTEMIEDGW